MDRNDRLDRAVDAPFGVLGIDVAARCLDIAQYRNGAYI
jgi:hypothetical protein